VIDEYKSSGISLKAVKAEQNFPIDKKLTQKSS